MRVYTDSTHIYFIQSIEIFLGFLLRDYLFITTTIIFVVFLAWLLNGKNGSDDLPGGATSPQASMKLSPPHRSPALPRRGPHYRHPCPPRRRCCCSTPPPRRCSPAGMAGAAGTARTADSPAQGG